MKTIDIDKNILDSYLDLLKKLSSKNKQELIEILSKTIVRKERSPISTTVKSFGAFESNESAEELINQLYSARKVNRSIESLD
jgi:hypothetical protein